MKDKEVLYAKWLNGEITDEELRAAEGDNALKELKRVTGTVDGWSMPKYDASAGYEKFKQVHQRAPAKVRRINWFAVGGIAASVLALVVFGSIYLTNQDEIIFAENGQNQNVGLSDGSEVWLNDGSTVEYNAEDWANQRTIELSGEALFDVTKGSPFVVNTKHGSIRVLGTQFNVRAWGENLYVECYEGSVRVTVSAQETTLAAKEAVNVVRGKMSGKNPVLNTSPPWQNGTSRFYNEQLQDVFAEIERQFDVKVEVRASDRSFSGNFRHQDLENALLSVCKPLGLNFTISADGKTVVVE